MDNDDEDEETLQLRLAALEAKLKLKKLQSRKSKKIGSDQPSSIANPERLAGTGKENLFLSPHEQYKVRPKLAVAKSSTNVEIPVSPHKRVATEEVHSPGRVTLGIDKGLKGKNISLRRPAEEGSKNDDPYRRITASSGPARGIHTTYNINATPCQPQTKSYSFSDKIAETRRQDIARKEKSDIIRKNRSTGFGINQKEMNELSRWENIRSKLAETQQEISEFSRDEIMTAAYKTNANRLQRRDKITGIRLPAAQGNCFSGVWTDPNAPPEPPKLSVNVSNASKKRSHSLSPPPRIPEPKTRHSSPRVSSLFEPFSSLHLSSRLSPQDFVTRTFSEKHVFRLPDLLASVKSPEYSFPDIAEPDYVVLAIVASKSDPLNHKGSHKIPSSQNTSSKEAFESEQNVNGKYMALTLTDLKWTIDLYLFTTAYTRFRKLTPGTVVALLNPDIMPPPPDRADTGRFSLKLGSNDDTILEIGTSRDLGWCKSRRKDGKQCPSWVDKRHTEFCEFHVDIIVERTRRGRMEVQGMSAPFAPGGKRGGRTGHFANKRRNGWKGATDDGLMKEGAQYDRSSGSTYFVGMPPPGGRSAAQLMDAEGSIESARSKTESVRKRLAERERENEIARKLGQKGNGAGSEYLRLRQGDLLSEQHAVEQQMADPMDAMSLGLLGNRATNVQLSPLKKRKGVVVDADGVRKKTRFVTERGIKEAGRESFGRACGGAETQDEDDDLEVI